MSSVPRSALVLGLTPLFPATAALAQGVSTMIKTPPLQQSDTFTIHISIHNTAPNPPWAGWAGAIMEMHLLDNTELDITAVHAGLPMRATGTMGSVLII